MVGQRHRTVRPAPIWRGSQRPVRAHSTRPLSSYSHINIQPAEENLGQEYGALTEASFRRDSLQEEIDASLYFTARTSQTTAPSTGPRTFAEAAMSTRRAGHNGNENADPSHEQPTGLEPQVSTKYTFKKKKKTTRWTPFDLGAAESTSETGSLPGSASLSRVASPALVTSTTSTSCTATALPLETATTPYSPPTATVTFPTLGEAYQAPSASASTCGDAQAVSTGAASSQVDTVALPSLALDETEEAPVQGCGSLLVASIPSLEGALIQSMVDDEMETLTMPAGAGNDIEKSHGRYNSFGWNPELSPAHAASKSPEASPTPAQPVTYTTVGSIVDPKAVPQFTAPNRIQREGAGRRPFPMIQNRQYDSFYGYRGNPPHMNSSLYHGHMAAQTSNHFDLSHGSSMNVPRSMLSTHPFQQNYSLTEQEGSILSNLQGPSGNNMFATSSQNHSVGIPPPNYAMGPTNMSQSFGAGNMMGEDVGRCYAGTQGSGPLTGPVQGLEKMQTLQRLAKFENPMQSLALSRLSAFSVSKSSSITPTGPKLPDDEPGVGENSAATLPSTGEDAQQPGELNRAYKFPLPTAVDTPTPQANPLYGAFSPSTMRPSNDSTAPQTGYPAPLTAGPPGQRQFQSTVNRTQTIYSDGPWGLSAQPFTPYAGAQIEPSSIQSDGLDGQYTHPYVLESIIPSHNRRKCKTQMVDTLDLDDVLKYYPRGIPPDMNGNIRPLSVKFRRELDVVSGDALPETAEEIAARKKKDLDDWFYDGQRRFAGMTGLDHIHEYEDRQLESMRPQGTITSKPKKPRSPVQSNIISAEEMEKMSMAQAAGPLLNAGFGALLTFSTGTDGPDSARVLSRFAPSEAWQLDESKDGNRSFYANPPPKWNGDGPQQSN